MAFAFIGARPGEGFHTPDKDQSTTAPAPRPRPRRSVLILWAWTASCRGSCSSPVLLAGERLHPFGVLALASPLHAPAPQLRRGGADEDDEPKRRPGGRGARRPGPRRPGAGRRGTRRPGRRFAVGQAKCDNASRDQRPPRHAAFSTRANVRPGRPDTCCVTGEDPVRRLVKTSSLAARAVSTPLERDHARTPVRSPSRYTGLCWPRDLGGRLRGGRCGPRHRGRRLLHTPRC